MIIAEKTTRIAPNIPAIAGGDPIKKTPYGSAPRYGEDELNELREALDQGSLFYMHGRKVRQLEEEFAVKHGAQFAIACTSGTSALHAAMIALGISPGDEVIVPPLTDMGTMIPILFQGAVPVFADVTPHGYVLDPAAVEAAITERTKAIIAVHLGGNACDLAALGALCDKYGLLLIEDCAQAFGTTWQGKPVGTIGEVGCFSFNEYKHIACGDGGIILTNNEETARRLRLATDKCYNRRPDALERSPIFLANNYRMTELQGAVARAQLRKLDGIIAGRRRWAYGLSDLIRDTPGIRLPEATPGSEHSWWFYQLRVCSEEMRADAPTVARALQAEGIRAGTRFIGTTVYRYPVFANHAAFANSAHPFERIDYRDCHCPIAEEILDTAVVLPVHECFTDADRDEVAEAIRRVAAWFTAGKAEAF
jgi:dTDP-4-amino-4,6-dideoxygalactose transaminase